ncbi:FAD-dependent oxidoreductase [Sporomusa acidovorans]|uniref:FAD dependent oxidoreductase domain-containing protein n=1 Tax=Sporomusa acidovorans (strain ATCC 49682 / DSM 3132 / Mol) TaxID=1123286 RepID=A0ABZ3J260_SPOA4|nr:FAD-dependent oxidoreductase [Sporomusa acidovorans]OZC15785.1 L-2-hydroxyglutarate oxidase LhgO [Sporomusa acidovorans DSM 3132]SDF63987.1 FAD dependent oxidoreductase [Sporomusa acidovorans]
MTLKLSSEVAHIQPIDTGFTLTTQNGEKILARYVVNAAGIHSDQVAGMVGINDYHLTPRRGQYVILDKEQNYLAKSVIFQVPTKLGKVILVTTTYHGNLMIGPNAEEIEDKEDVSTDDKTLLLRRPLLLK